MANAIAQKFARLLLFVIEKFVMEKFAHVNYMTNAFYNFYSTQTASFHFSQSPSTNEMSGYFSGRSPNYVAFMRIEQNNWMHLISKGSYLHYNWRLSISTLQLKTRLGWNGDERKTLGSTKRNTDEGRRDTVPFAILQNAQSCRAPVVHCISQVRVVFTFWQATRRSYFLLRGIFCQEILPLHCWSALHFVHACWLECSVSL